MVPPPPQHLTCPRCKTVVTVPAGTPPVCPSCEFPGPDHRPGHHPPPPQGAASAGLVATGHPAGGPTFSVPPAIELRGVSKRYGKVLAVDDLTFTVPRGGVVGFIGPNGAGKTTTIRILMGLIQTTTGQARVLGHDVRHPTRYLPRVGALIESPSFYPQLSGRRNLEVLAILGGHDRSRIDAILEQVGLAERGADPFRSYSLGMKQRLGIAAALLPDPELLILDEPTNGLDPAGIREMRALLRRIGDSGRTVFVSSHLLAEIQRMCDHLVILRKGRLIFHGTVDKLLEQQDFLIVAPADVSRGPALAQLVKAAGYAATPGPTPGSLLVRAPLAAAGPLNERAMRAGIVLGELHAQPADLEETVLRMTGKGAL